jgi:hypothetical protein
MGISKVAHEMNILPVDSRCVTLYSRQKLALIL